ncbi:MAG TPA: hypothetical protein DD435_00975 [Cyanobacteria bacterium UBA8530]|nr:hypothetical protein [Cyanobacteria bacterium UBA8530]
MAFDFPGGAEVLNKVIPAGSSSSEEQTRNLEDGEKYIAEASYSVNALDNTLDGFREGAYQSKEDASKFFSSLKDLDYLNKRNKISELVAKHPELKNDYKYDVFTKEFPKKFEDFVAGKLVAEVNSTLDYAYQQFKNKSSLGTAADAAEAALLVCQGILTVSPENSKVKALEKDARVAVSKIGQSASSAIYTSSFHKENVGKIVFFKSPVQIKKEGRSASQFTSADSIYSIAYFNGSVKELSKDEQSCMKVVVDGNEKLSRRFTITAERAGLSYLDLEILPEPASSKQMGAVEYAKALSEISPRAHQVEFSLFLGDTDRPAAVGSFELDCSGGVEKIAERAKGLRTKALANVLMPKALMSNPSLEKAILDCLKEPGGDIPLRVVLLNKDWRLHRNPLTSIIEYRSIDTAVASKLKNGNHRVFYMSFKQDYDGRTYGRTEFNAMGDFEDIAPQNIFK